MKSVESLRGRKGSICLLENDDLLLFDSKYDNFLDYRFTLPLLVVETNFGMGDEP